MSNFSLMRKPIPASDIASYAADPRGYCERRGDKIDSKRAQEGVRVHEEFGSPRTFERWLPYILTAIALLMLLVGVKSWW